MPTPVTVTTMALAPLTWALWSRSGDPTKVACPMFGVVAVLGVVEAAPADVRATTPHHVEED